MEFMQNKQITISTLSPVHIGCDEDYVPTNFVIKNNLLHYFDIVSLVDELTEAERTTLGNQQTIGAVQQFFKSKRDRLTPLASHLVEMASDIANEYEDKAGKPTQQGAGGAPTYNLFPIARTAYNPLDASPYLPGSSLKGSMRTAWLNAVNKGQYLQPADKIDKKNINRTLQQRLLGYTSGKFENDPLRHLLVADAHDPEDGEPAPAQVLYAVSKKKRLSERSTPELKVFLEAMHGLLPDAFSGEIRFTGDKISWATLCDACNSFYIPQLQAELNHPHLSPMLNDAWRMLVNELLNGELNELRQQRQGFLLRVGKHSGAESVTLNGVRDIKILGKQGEPPSYRPETTEKRFSSLTKKAESGLLPFGWIWVESCEDNYQHISRSLRDKLQPHARKLREVQRERLQQLEATRQTRQLAAQAAEQQRQQAEVEARQRAEAEEARQLALASMTPNQQEIEKLRTEIENKLKGGKLKISDAFWGGRIKKLAEHALTSADWSAEEKSALADMLQEWAGQLMALDAKDLRKQLKFSALRGQA
jgi:CRISPR-associated protein Csm5